MSASPPSMPIFRARTRSSASTRWLASDRSSPGRWDTKGASAPEGGDMRLDATTSAVVTGGASGLGAATARALATLGVKVAIFDLNEGKGGPLAQEIGAVFCKVDVTDDASVDAGF